MPRSDSQFSVRWPIASELLALGLSTDRVAFAIGWSDGTVAKDARTMGGMAKLFPNRPRRDGDVYTAVWSYWWSKSFEKFEVAMVSAVKQHLEQFLGLPQIEMYFRGLCNGQDNLTWPQVKAPIGYLRLFETATAIRVMRKPNSMYLDRGLLLEVLDTMSTPHSMTEVLDHLTTCMSVRFDRGLIIFPGTDDLQAKIDVWLADDGKCTPVEREVLTYRFGLDGQPGMEQPEIGQRMERTRERIRQIEVKALRKFRQGLRGLIRECDEQAREVRGQRDDLRQKYADSANEAAQLREQLGEAKRRFPQSFPEEAVTMDVTYLEKRCDELYISVRSANCLQNSGIEWVGQLVQCTPEGLLKSRNFGRKSLNEIRDDILPPLGLSLGMKLPPNLAARFPMPEKIKNLMVRTTS